jgi:hypothetical protein
MLPCSAAFRSQGRVEPSAIVEGLEQDGSSPLEASCPVAAIDELGLAYRKALGDRLIPATALAAHAHRHSELSQCCPVFGAAERSINGRQCPV